MDLQLPVILSAVSRADVSADFGWSLKVTHIRPAVNNYTGVSVSQNIRKEASYYEAGWLDWAKM